MPVGNDHTGPGPMRALMERHPTLTAVVAHLGAPEYAGFVAIAEDFERVHLDTTMAFTDFFEEMAAFPRDLMPRLVELQDRVLLGSASGRTGSAPSAGTTPCASSASPRRREPE